MYHITRYIQCKATISLTLTIAHISCHGKYLQSAIFLKKNFYVDLPQFINWTSFGVTIKEEEEEKKKKFWGIPSLKNASNTRTEESKLICKWFSSEFLFEVEN